MADNKDAWGELERSHVAQTTFSLLTEPPACSNERSWAVATRTKPA
jgi:hypothetical protein